MLATEYFSDVGAKTSGWVSQKGLFVLRPSFALFVPSERGGHLVAFDEHIASVWHKAGWWYATPDDASAVFKIAFLFDRYRLVIRRGKEVAGSFYGVPGNLAPSVDPLLASWPRVDR